MVIYPNLQHNCSTFTAIGIPDTKPLVASASSQTGSSNLPSTLILDCPNGCACKVGISVLRPSALSGNNSSEPVGLKFSLVVAENDTDVQTKRNSKQMFTENLREVSTFMFGLSV